MKRILIILTLLLIPIVSANPYDPTQEYCEDTMNGLWYAPLRGLDCYGPQGEEYVSQNLCESTGGHYTNDERCSCSGTQTPPIYSDYVHGLGCVALGEEPQIQLCEDTSTSSYTKYRSIIMKCSCGPGLNWDPDEGCTATVTDENGECPEHYQTDGYGSCILNETTTPDWLSGTGDYIIFAIIGGGAALYLMRKKQ